MQNSFISKLKPLDQVIYFGMQQADQMEEESYKNKRMNRIYLMELRQCQDIFPFFQDLSQMLLLDPVLLRKLVVFISKLQDRQIQFEQDCSQTMVDICIWASSKLQGLNPQIQNSDQQIQATHLFFNYCMQLYEFLQERDDNPQNLKQIVNVIISLHMNNQQQFIADIPFTKFAHTLLKESSSQSSCQAQFQLSFLICAQMSFYLQINQLSKVDDFKKIIMGVILMMKKISNQMNLQKLTIGKGNICMRVLQMNIVFKKILENITNLPDNIAHALLDSELLANVMILFTRRTRFPTILQKFIQVLIQYQKFNALFYHILIYALKEYSIVMGILDFTPLLTDKFIFFVLDTVLFNQDPQKSQSLASVFLNDPFGCVLFLDMLSHALKYFSEVQAKKVLTAMMKIEFLSQVKGLIQIDSTVREKMIQFIALTRQFGNVPFQLVDIENLLNSIPYPNKKFSLQY